MKRILFVFHDSSVSGGSLCLFNLLKAIDRSAFEPFVLVAKDGPLCREIAGLGISVELMPELTIYPINRSLFAPGSVKSILRIRKSTGRFGEVLKKTRPDIVYLNTMMLFPYLRTAKEAGCKTIIHIREHWAEGEHAAQFKRIRKAVHEYADRVVAINSYSASMFPGEHATVIYDWVDMESRRGGPSLQDLIGDCSGLKVYLYLGGMRNIKGPAEVLKTFSEHIKGGDRRLLALGLSPEMDWNGIKGKVKRVLSPFGIRTYKEKTVRLCRKDPRIICAPQVFKITGLMEQIAGYVSFFKTPHANLTMAESIIMHLPSVAANTEEALEYSDGGKLSLLYEFNNLEDFRDKWLALDRDEGAIKKRLAEGSGVIAEMFNPQRNIDTFNKVLNSFN